MTVARASAGSVIALRIAYGIALIVAPRRLALRWLGPAAEDQVALRALGAALTSIALAVAVDS